MCKNHLINFLSSSLPKVKRQRIDQELLSFLPESYYQWSLDVQTKAEYRLKSKKLATILASPISGMSGDDADDENEGEQVMAQADQSIVVQEYDWKKIVVELKLRTITDSTSRQAKKSGSKNQQQNNGKPQQQNNGKQSQSFKQKAPVTS